MKKSLKNQYSMVITPEIDGNEMLRIIE